MLTLKNMDGYRGIKSKNIWYLEDYHPETKYEQGTTSCNLLDLKNAGDVAVEQWTNKLIAALLFCGIRFDYIIRALNSTETKAVTNKGMDRLCETVAKKLNAIYDAFLLRKTRTTVPLHNLKLRQRQTEMKGQYFVQPHKEIPWFTLDKKNVLLIDDITTTGTTIREIAQAINATYPNVMLHIICLCKTKNVRFERCRINVKHAPVSGFGYPPA